MASSPRMRAHSAASTTAASRTDTQGAGMPAWVAASMAAEWRMEAAASTAAAATAAAAIANRSSDKERPSMRNLKISAIFALLIALYAQLCAAQQPASATFASAEEASRALYQAARSNDQAALAKILGPDNASVSGQDQAEERREREQFARKYDEMHRLVGEADGSLVLYVGAENWPFPFPLVQEKASWHFDPEGGMQEVLARRIGGGGLVPIATARAPAAPGQKLQPN